MTDRSIKNARILEAFSMIDEKYIGEVASSLKLDDYSEEPPKPSIWKSLKPVLALAACVLLLGALFPVTMKLINNWNGPAAGSESSEETTDKNDQDDSDHNVYMIPYSGPTLMRYNTVSGKYSEIGKSVDIYTEYNGKIYYIRWARDEETLSKQILSCYDPETGTSIDLLDLPSNRRSMLIANDGFLYFSTTQAAYRIPAEGGEAELLFDINDNEAVYCVIDKKVIFLNRFTNIISPSTPQKSTITAFDLDTRKKEILWSAENTEYGMIWGMSYYDDKLYIGISKNGFAGKVLTEFDLETRELHSVLEKPLSSYCFTPEGIYYYLYEPRTVNWRSMFSSQLADKSTTLSPELYKCDFEGKNSEVVFKNSDFAVLTYQISDGKMIGSFCGDFPALGWKRAYLILSIDLSTGELTLIDKPEHNNYESEKING